jgi:ABC-type amino acid transport substrate-binding protein
MKTSVIIGLSSGLAALALTACSVSTGTLSLSSDEVEQKATAALAEGQGIPLEEMPPLECPSDLPAEVGATMVCVIGDPAQGNTYDVTITVETVEGDDVGFDIQVADTPRE